MKLPISLNPRLVWSTLLLMMVALAVVRSVAHGGQLEAWLGHRFLLNTRMVLGLLAALVVAWIAVRATQKEAVRAYPALDFAFILMVSSWVLSSAVVLVQEALPTATYTSAARHTAYQLSVAATLNFLRNTTQLPTPGARLLIGIQLALGLGLVAWRYGQPTNAAWSLEAWRITNLLGFSLVFLAICRTHLSDMRYPPWLSLGACLMGFGMGMNDMALADGVALQVSGMHNMFSAYLLLVWLMLTNRIGHLYAPHKNQIAHSEDSILGGDFANSYLDQARAEEPEGEPSDLAQTKRRFAQELHDGVGSQLVSILASLDRGVPQQREMAAAVEHCLLDVKILVDDIDGGEECVLDAMARLRYRVQASLDQLGIALTWDVHPDPALEQLQDERSRQVLRIAQEALANVMRHSRAQNVQVTCAYQPDLHSLLLEISDDGKGFDVPQQVCALGGKGLLGMHRRAQSLVGHLEVLSAPGKGTRVSLLLPLGGMPPSVNRLCHGGNGPAADRSLGKLYAAESVF